MLINSSISNYSVDFFDSFDSFKELSHIQNKFIVIDKKVYELYSDIFSIFRPQEIYLIEATEENKTFIKAVELYEKLISFNTKRNTTLISIGGGIIQDISGFVASTLYRGIQWIYIPTTLLAQTDSCIGSKTSLNFLDRKNLLGTFYPPKKIFIIFEFLKTLLEKDYKSGVGEIIKLHLISGVNNFEFLSQNLNDLSFRSTSVLKGFIKNSLKIKKAYIEVDEFDLDKRKILNFGHTFGHALESISNYRIPHGQAVLYGIMLTNRLGYLRKLLGMNKIKEIDEICLMNISEILDVKQLEFDKLFSLLKYDKKRESSFITDICIDHECNAYILDDFDHEQIKEAYQIFQEAVLN